MVWKRTGEERREDTTNSCVYIGIKNRNMIGSYLNVLVVVLTAIDLMKTSIHLFV